ncbi:MAG: response regulator [Candidatus Liptonbacteria bacterium]
MTIKSGSSKKKVLHIEDDELVVRVCSVKLGQEGIEVVRALDGEEGLAKTVSENPDVVLLDLMLPNRDGYWYLEEVARKPDLKNIPVVVFSNLAQQTDIDRATQLGVKDYFVKINSTIAEVVEAVKKHLG